MRLKDYEVEGIKNDVKKYDIECKTNCKAFRTLYLKEQKIFITFLIIK